MFEMLKPKQPSKMKKAIILKAEFKELLLYQFDTIADISTPQGRRRVSLIGTERKQLNLVICVEVMKLLEADLREKGTVLDPDMDHYLSDRGRRRFVGAIMNRHSAFNLVEIPDAPIETLFKSSKDFVRIRIEGRHKRPGPGRYSYVTKRTAPQLVVLAAFNTHRDEQATRAVSAGKKLDAYSAALQCWPADLTFEEAFAEEAKRRRERR